jgi:hypothetical protein
MLLNSWNIRGVRKACAILLVLAHTKAGGRYCYSRDQANLAWGPILACLDVTHLAVHGAYSTWAGTSGFELLRRLTHLRLNIRYALPEYSGHLCESVARILSSNTNLQILVFFDESKRHEMATFANPRTILISEPNCRSSPCYHKRL